MSTFKGFVVFLVFCVLAACAAACARAPDQDPMTPHDPFERYNRGVASFNRAANRTVIHPVLRGYRVVVPNPARKGLSNFLENLRAPTIIANQALQGDWQGTHDAAARGIVNTLLGVGGIFDVASVGGIPEESEDFGQTLAVWGVSSGPFVVVPLIGPSSVRDYVGYGVDVYTHPLNMYLRNVGHDEWNYARVGASYLHVRESIMDGVEALENNSLDPYAAMRSAYYQARNAAIRDESPGAPSVTPDIPDVEEGQ